MNHINVRTEQNSPKSEKNKLKRLTHIPTYQSPESSRKSLSKDNNL